MIRAVLSRLRRFRSDEAGSATVEFAIYATLLFVVLAVGVEFAYMNLRHAMLERALDLVVRDIRLGTGNAPSYETVRGKICKETAIAEDCDGNLRLEMMQVDPRAFVGLPADADCANIEEDPRPVRHFQPGLDNDLMLIRACLKFQPMFPTTGFGGQLHKDAEGYAQLVATSAFVQEPR
ncbi:TadE/TadG family type IV pilus assembly protein [Salipiger mucosus]|uniref:Flp pilus assembly protein TadG n=1 Tax=Salipiger mucosus DSM 16094 TaxID=1123237 RepID=S9R0X7_9RHOB|nr:TadE/TadG family type IV pilus assembly protein [Salipiger mucosus]EPX85573.1 Flp pilus assembly protein TadG [Salipiger mucosus DSM 16094]